MFALATPHALAEDLVAAPLVTGGATTIIYVFPTSPQTFVPVAGLPSFLVMPGAPVPAVATEVVYSTPGPVPSTAVASVKVDCRNFGGVVTIAGPDVFNLDKDNDGVGCEPEDR
jgi:hypothetical protein